MLRDDEEFVIPAGTLLEEKGFNDLLQWPLPGRNADETLKGHTVDQFTIQVLIGNRVFIVRDRKGDRKPTHGCYNKESKDIVSHSSGKSSWPFRMSTDCKFDARTTHELCKGCKHAI